jgi:cysteine desulfurase
MRRIYLDHTATTPLDSRVADEMAPYFTAKFGNASSIHSFGQEARAALDGSRDRIAGFLGAASGEITFTGSGTEADNFALKGTAHARRRLAGKDHILTSAVEHHAVLETCRYLEGEGFSVTYLPVDRSGTVSAKAVQDGIRPGTALVSIMHANNEIGTINPIEEITRVTREKGIPLHSDAVQSFGKIPVNVDALGVDLLTISAHKIYGPKGIGALYIRRGMEIDPFIHGGGQERGRRAGTENVPLAVGFAKAGNLIIEEREAESARLTSLRDEFRTMLLERLPGIIINTAERNTLSHILNISFDSSKIRIDGEALLFNLDLAGIAVTSGSACTSGSMEPSHVLLALGRDPATAKASIRFSMGRSTTIGDLRAVAGSLEQIVQRIGTPV